MGSVTVAASKDRFLRDGRPFFYLADTCWSAFTNVRPGEWEQYLDVRAAQGFNALQITILPQWDRTVVDFAPPPFRAARDGSPDYARPEDSYFENASRMLEAAVSRGFVPALVLLWCDRVRGTWACRRMPDHEMPLEAIAPFVRYAAKTFGRFDPLWLVSGDTDLLTEDTVERYLLALRTVKEAMPDSLTTLHLQPQTDLPERVEQARELDFYMYQSGHHVDQTTAYLLAERFAGKSVKRPVVNGEPCYEAHGFGNSYGRFGAFHVRKAIWQSLLAGAKAGVTYGAHGIWSWHRRGMPFGAASFSSLPLPWNEALRLEGAWDAGYARWLFDVYALADLDPVTVPGLHAEVRVAASPSGTLVAAYAPYAAEIDFGRDLSGHEAVLVDLAARRIVRPVLRHGVGGSRLVLPDANADMLFVARTR
jgi:hypothetical protein